MLFTPMGLSHVVYWTRRRLAIHYPRLLGTWLLGRDRPEVILVELTNACNQACPFCAREVMSRRVGDMSYEVFTSIIDQAAQFPYVLLRIVGLGEAAMHPRFRECVNYATARNIPIEITSNGHIFEVMSPTEIINSSIIMLSISIDGFSDGSYEKLRVGGNYQTLRENITSFHRAKAITKSKRPLFTLRNVLLSKVAHKRAAQAARFKAEWSGLCDRISFNDYTPQALTENNEGKLRVCDNIFYNLHVEWDGRTPLCAYQHLIVDQEYTGNVGEMPVKEIWNDRRRQEVRQAHISGDLSVASFCQKCPKTRKTAVYRNIREHGSHSSALRHGLERLLWRIVG
ncbi:radical SAM protein [Cypionkella sp.]|uniref:radical SAM protein n=1 Tax=Cypionkella sp. TaxID=2811411 RepID=UPI0026313843|nr:radical SAM protein [Cypionkella sp.]